MCVKRRSEMYKTIKFEIKDNIGYITINRPEALNALNMDVLKDLKRCLAEISSKDAVRAIIVTGEGRSFVAGADIVQMKKLTPVKGREMMELGHEVMNTIEQIQKPFIAAVNGFALGGGCELAMACDIRIASEKAKFGQPEVGLGIIPGFGGTQRLPRLVGKGMAKYLIYTADIIPADEALRIGLVEKVVTPEDLMKEAEDVAKKITSKAPIAVGIAKTAINNGTEMDIKSASRLEVESEAVCFATKDKAEGMAAFVEKRPPEFKNK